MSNRPPTMPTALDRFWGAVGHLGNVQFIFSAAVSCIATARKLAGVKADWGPYVVAIAGAWFFGTLFVAILITHIARWLLRKRLQDTVSILAYGGESGALRVTRFGEAAEVFVEANVISWTGGNPLEERPFTVTWEYEGDQRLFPQEQQLASAHLADGRAASLVLVQREPPLVALQARQPGAKIMARVLPDSEDSW